MRILIEIRVAGGADARVAAAHLLGSFVELDDRYDPVPMATSTPGSDSQIVLVRGVLRAGVAASEVVGLADVIAVWSDAPVAPFEDGSETA